MDGSSENQGAIGDFRIKTTAELQKILLEQKKLLKKALNTPDGGKKIQNKINQLESLIQDRLNLNESVHSPTRKSTKKSEQLIDDLSQGLQNVTLKCEAGSNEVKDIPRLTEYEILELERKYLGDHVLSCNPCDKSLPDQKYRFLAFDLETNKLGHDAEIVQLAVIDCSVPSTCLSLFCLPSWMAEEASKVTGLRLVTPLTSASDTTPTLVNGKGETLSTVSLKHCLTKFTEFVNAYQNCTPVLVAHNGHNFDFPVLINQFAKVDLPIPNCLIADTLKIAKTLKNRGSNRVTDRIRLIDLVTHLQPHLEFSAHDALEDCRALRSILLPWEPRPQDKKEVPSCLCKTEKEFMKLGDSMHIAQLQFEIRQKTISDANLDTMKYRIFNTHPCGVVSEGIARRIAKAGFDYERLRILAIQGGWNCFAGLLASQETSRRASRQEATPRVSWHKPTLIKIYEHLWKVHRSLQREASYYAESRSTSQPGLLLPSKSSVTKGPVSAFGVGCGRVAQQLSVEDSLSLMKKTQDDQEKSIRQSAEDRLKENAHIKLDSSNIINTHQYRTKMDSDSDDSENDSDSDMEGSAQHDEGIMTSDDEPLCNS